MLMNEIVPATTKGGETMDDNLKHVLADDCQDPDCELHNIDVALEEQVVGANEAAFFLAGAQAYRDLLTQYQPHVAMYNLRSLITQHLPKES
jgi:hypothetical protein